MTAEALQRARRVRLPWRAAFVAYALALTVATHWPALRLGTEAVPAPDKILHMIAFGLIVGLLWRTRWLRAPWAVVAVVLAWSALDELSQALPVLHRTVSLQDLAAGWLGVLVAVAWWWALAPVGGAASLRRRAWCAYLVDEHFARWQGWVGAGAAGLLGAVVLGAAGTALAGLAAGGEFLLAALILAACGGGALAAAVVVAGQIRRRAAAIAAAQPCLACGAACRDVRADGQGRGRCPACGEGFRSGQWVTPVDLPLPAALGGGWAAAGAGLAVIVAAAAAGLGAAILADWWSPARSVLRWWESLRPDLRLAWDVTVAAVALAVAARVYRRRQAALLDGAAASCRGCGGDLSAAPVARGVGRCPRCGLAFARLAP